MKRKMGIGLLVGLWLIGGCGKTDQDVPPRFNETLGDSPVGAPPGSGPIDTGILKDPATYQPATYEPLSPADALPTETENPAVMAVRTTMNQAIDGVFAMDFESLLGAFTPQKVGALAKDDYIDNLNALSDALRTSNRVLKEKASGPELSAITQMQDFFAGLGDTLKTTLVINVLDEQEARATLDLNRLPPEKLAQLGAILQQIMTLQMSMSASVMPGMVPGMTPDGQSEDDQAPLVAPAPELVRGRSAPPAQASEPAGAEETTIAPPGTPAPDLASVPPEVLLSQMAMPAITLRKIGDSWKIDLPLSLTEEHAELINDAVLALKTLMDDMTQAMEQAPTVDLQTYMQITAQIQARHMPVLMGIIGRAMPLLGSLMETDPSAGAPAPQSAEESETEDYP